MIDLKLNDITEKVRFDEPSHVYTNTTTGANLTGITTMMKLLGLSHDYSGIPQSILESAAEHGTKVHNMCYTKDNSLPETDFYVNEIEKRGLIPVSYEYLVSDFYNVASQIDIVFTTKELAKENKVILADIKTTAQYDGEQLSWQLSFYKKLFEEQNMFLKVDRVIGIWLPNSEKYEDKKPKFTDVELVEDDVVDSAFKAFINKSEFVNPKALLVKQSTEIAPISIEVRNFLSALDELKKKEKEFKEQMLEFMAKYSPDDPIEKNGVRVTYVKGHLEDKFDSTKFKKENPELYKKYCNQTMVKESIRIKIK